MTRTPKPLLTFLRSIILSQILTVPSKIEKAKPKHDLKVRWIQSNPASNQSLFNT